MKIGIVTTWFERGAAYVSRQYMEALSSEHEVVIYVRAGEKQAVGDPKWDHEWVTWGKRRRSRFSTKIDLPDFKKWLEKEKVEIVFFNEQTWWPPVFLCQDLGIITGSYVDYYRENDVALFANYDFLMCNTQRHYSVFDWHPAAHFVQWGTDTSLFRPSAEGSELGKEVRFFHSAGMDPYRKGADLLIEAFSKLNAGHLTIHAQVDLRKAMPDHIELLDRLISEKRLTCIEKDVGPPGLYSEGDVYVYPSRLEGIGLSVPEALACGLTCIVPDSPPMSEFVEDGVTGKTVPVNRFICRPDGYYWPQSMVGSDALAEALRWFIENHEQIPEMKRAARASAEETFNWHTNAACIGGLFGESVRLTGEIRQKARELAETLEAERTTPWDALPGFVDALIHPVWRRIKPYLNR